MKQLFTRADVFVIKACKGHFSHIRNDSAWENAELIIQKIIYQHPKPLPHLLNIQFAHGILFKTRNWVAEEWGDFAMKQIEDADKDEWFLENKNPFLKRLQCRYFAEITNLKVQSGDTVKIDLSITDEEMETAQKALQ